MTQKERQRRHGMVKFRRVRDCLPFPLGFGYAHSAQTIER